MKNLFKNVGLFIASWFVITPLIIIPISFYWVIKYDRELKIFRSKNILVVTLDRALIFLIGCIHFLINLIGFVPVVLAFCGYLGVLAHEIDAHGHHRGNFLQQAWNTIKADFKRRRRNENDDDPNETDNQNMRRPPTASKAAATPSLAAELTAAPPSTIAPADEAVVLTTPRADPAPTDRFSPSTPPERKASAALAHS